MMPISASFSVLSVADIADGLSYSKECDRTDNLLLSIPFNMKAKLKSSSLSVLNIMFSFIMLTNYFL